MRGPGRAGEVNLRGRLPIQLLKLLRLAQQYEHLLINRALVAGAHIVLASVVAVVYLNRLYFPSLPDALLEVREEGG